VVKNGAKGNYVVLGRPIFPQESIDILAYQSGRFAGLPVDLGPKDIDHALRDVKARDLKASFQKLKRQVAGSATYVQDRTAADQVLDSVNVVVYPTLLSEIPDFTVKPIVPISFLFVDS
jgi:hypothetical protein